MTEIRCDVINCFTSAQVQEENFLRNIIAPVAFHKTYFYKGIGRHVPAILIRISTTYLQYASFYNDPHICSRFAGTGKDNIIEEKCEYRVRALAELARIQNVSS